MTVLLTNNTHSYSVFDFKTKHIHTITHVRESVQYRLQSSLPTTNTQPIYAFKCTSADDLICGAAVSRVLLNIWLFGSGGGGCRCLYGWLTHISKNRYIYISATNTHTHRIVIINITNLYSVESGNGHVIGGV